MAEAIVKPEDLLQLSIKKGHVTEPTTSEGKYHCQLCTKDLKTKPTMKKHLDSQGHQEKVMAQTSGQITDKLQLAIKMDHVTKPKNPGEPYHCKLCDQDLKTKQTLKKHFESKTHQNNESEFELRGQDVASDTEDNIGKEESTPRREKKSDVAYPNPKQNEKTRPVEPYRVASSPRGHVHVFNYTFLEQKEPMKERKGAQYDSKNLKKTFTQMGYEVFLHENFTEVETVHKFDAIINDPQLEKVDVLITFFLSHGSDKYTFYSNDGKAMDLRVFWDKLTDTACPAMKKKPKLFFTNYCRGHDMELEETDGVVDIPRDLVNIHATTAGITAPRKTRSGTKFVLALCEVLKQHAKDLDLRDIYAKLDVEVKKIEGRTVHWEDTRFRKFYFNPKE